MDKLKANYNRWREYADLFLISCSLRSYVTGHISAPPTNEPHALANWQSNDEMAAAMLFGTIEETEWQFLDRSLGAKVCWDTNLARHQNEGPICQVTYLQEALSTKFSHGTPLPTTAAKICTAIRQAYNMGNISCDLMTCITLLSDLTDFPHCRSIISRDITSSIKSNPITSVQLLKYLEQEQALLDSDSKRLPTQDHITLSAHPKPGPAVICSNCKRSGHTITYCISPGGGMAGKTIEDSKQAWHHECDASRKTNPGSLSVHSPKHKVTVNVKGTDGHAYYMLVDAEQLTFPSQTMPSDFAGIAATPLTTSPAPSSIPSSHLEEEEFVSWLATEEDPQTTVDWSACGLSSPSLALAASESISTGQSYLSTCPF